MPTFVIQGAALVRENGIVIDVTSASLSVATGGANTTLGYSFVTNPPAGGALPQIHLDASQNVTVDGMAITDIVVRDMRLGLMTTTDGASVVLTFSHPTSAANDVAYIFVLSGDPIQLDSVADYGPFITSIVTQDPILTGYGSPSHPFDLSDVPDVVAFGETLIGTEGFDRISGGDFADTISGQGGLDILTGGEGADSFVFGAGDGLDVITDFASGTDVLTLDSGLGLSTAADALDHAHNLGRGVLFAFGDGDFVFLAGVADASFIADDILITG